MAFSRALRLSVPASRRVRLCQAVRHFSSNHDASTRRSGPRQPHIDLSTTQYHTEKILHALKSFLTLHDSSKLHQDSQSWSCCETWTCTNLAQGSSTPSSHSQAEARLCSITFSDDRTALAKMVGLDHNQRYMQLVRVNDDKYENQWLLTQEVIGGLSTTEESYSELPKAIQAYLEVVTSPSKVPSDFFTPKLDCGRLELTKSMPFPHNGLPLSVSLSRFLCTHTWTAFFRKPHTATLPSPTILLFPWTTRLDPT